MDFERILSGFGFDLVADENIDSDAISIGTVVGLICYGS